MRVPKSQKLKNSLPLKIKYDRGQRVLISSEGQTMLKETHNSNNWYWWQQTQASKTVLGIFQNVIS